MTDWIQVQVFQIKHNETKTFVELRFHEIFAEFYCLIAYIDLSWKYHKIKSQDYRDYIAISKGLLTHCGLTRNRIGYLRSSAVFTSEKVHFDHILALGLASWLSLFCLTLIDIYSIFFPFSSARFTISANHQIISAWVAINTLLPQNFLCALTLLRFWSFQHGNAFFFFNYTIFKID